jgi:ISXO2 transposase-like protein/transposase-like zinc ribbon protein
MAMNRIQFQHGMSLPEFLSRFGTEQQCAEALMAERWPEGFRCPGCDGAAHCVITVNLRPLFQCNACRRQTSITAGTMFAGTKLPLTTWFMAIYFISQAKTGLSALALKRHLGVSYPTAWLINQKIMCAMAEREATHTLGNVVQLDDAYLGGELSGGTAGRGSENKVPFVAAVSLDTHGHPAYVKLTPVAAFSRQAIGQWSATHLEPGTVVLSDGLHCFVGVVDSGCDHLPIVVGRRKPRDVPEFAWINTILGNLKTTLAGAHHAFKYSKYAEHYLGAFAYRFNRRFDLKGLVTRLLAAVTHCPPRCERAIRMAEAHC